MSPAAVIKILTVPRRACFPNPVRKLDNPAPTLTFHPADRIERAIAAFERATGLSVSLHHVDRTIWPFLPLWRFLHTSAACVMAKSEDQAACEQFDRVEVRRRLHETRRGIVKICHMGLVEWVVPVGSPQKIQLILFAGQGVPGKGLDAIPIFRSDAYLRRPRITRQSLHGPVTDQDARYLLELLEQLGARIGMQLQEIQGLPQDRFLRMREGDRRRSIERYVQHNHLQPIQIHDLADYLRLSPSRMARVVKQVTGHSFGDLLNHMRIRTAANLLEHTELNVLDVALHSGFQELSSFHRQFRRIFGQTPTEHRRAHQTRQSVVTLSISMARGIVARERIDASIDA